MEETILAQISELNNMSMTKLKKKYEEIFEGKNEPRNNKLFLVKRIAYKLQELEYGGLSQNAQNKVKELIQKYDPINHKNPEQNSTPPIKRSPGERDKRLPIPGTVLTKEYKGTFIKINVLENGFEFKEKFFKSLSSVAREITGDHWNGYKFFGL